MERRRETRECARRRPRELKQQRWNGWRALSWYRGRDRRRSCGGRREDEARRAEPALGIYTGPRRVRGNHHHGILLRSGNLQFIRYTSGNDGHVDAGPDTVCR